MKIILPGILLLQKICFFLLFLLPLAVFPVFHHAFFSTKWIILYITASLAGISIALYCVFIDSQVFFKLLKKLPSPLFWLLFLLVFVTFYNMVQHDFNDSFFLDRISIFILSLYFFLFLFISLEQGSTSIILEKITNVLILSTTFLFIFSEIKNIAFFQGGLFGNENMLAEFLGIVFLFVLYSLFYKKQPTTRFSFVLFVCLFLFLCFLVSSLFALRCRSVLIAVTVSSCAFYSLYKKRKFSPFLGFLFFSLGIFLILYVCDFAWLPDWIRSNKANEVHQNFFRLTLWKSTLKLIQDHPMGIGSGKFEFEILPYIENTVQMDVSATKLYRSPHNEYLRLAAEEGMIFTTLFLSFLFCLLYKIKKSIHFPFLFSLAIFLSVQAFFQFPLENAFPSFIFSIWLALCLFEVANLYPSQVKYSFFPLPNSRWIFVGLVSFQLYFTCSWITAHWIESREEKSYSWLKLACQISPSHWSLCLEKARQEFFSRNFTEAKKSLAQILDFSPHHFPALKLLSAIEFEENSPQKACILLKKYGQLLQDFTLYKNFCETKS